MNTNKNKNMKLNNNIYSDKKQNNFITSLPKANEIVDTTQEVKKSIYPFLMKCRKNNIINY